MKIKFLLTSLFCFSILVSSTQAQNSLAVTVFEDINGNGTDDGDPTIAGILMTELQLWQDINNNGAIDGGDVLFNHDGGIAGVYTFSALPDDNYILEYVEAGTPGSYHVTQLVGIADLDNDLDPGSNTAGLMLTGSVAETTIDVGLVIPGSIGSFTWEDTNGNGLQDGGEPGIDGVSVTLLNAMTMAPVTADVDLVPITNPTTSAGGGMYSFDNIAPGQYIVEFGVPAPSPAMWYPTVVTVDTDGTDNLNDSDAENNSIAANYLQTHTIILNSNETDEEDKIDAGFVQASIIGDFVWEDLNGDGIQDGGEPGIDGVTVSLLDDMGVQAIGVDGQPIMDQITAGGGLYQFDMVAPGDYQVEFSLPAPIGGVAWYPTAFDPAHTDANDPDTDSDANDDDTSPDHLRSHIITILNAEMDEEMRIDAGFWLPAMVGNMVFCDENGNGIDDDGVGGVDGVNVRLINTATGTTAQDAEGNNLTTTTAGGGMYMFELVPPGNYIIEFAFAPPLNDPPFTFTLQDDPGGFGTDFTDSDVDPNPFGGAFGQTEPFDVTSQDTEEEEKWDAGVYQEINIFGTIWLEDDANNMYDGELGPSGILVELIDANTLAKLDDFLTNQGDYEFIGLPPGDYIIQFDVTGTSLESATPCPGSNDANDMVDNDDNGIDATFVQTTPITILSNCDPNDPPVVNYVDFCYFFSCTDENSLASTACQDIQTVDIICEIGILGNFCNIMPAGTSGGTQPTPLCNGDDSGNPPGGAAHNISWFAFVAYGGNYTVSVAPTNCVGSTTGQEGVQIGLYTDCTFTESVYCNPACSLAPVSFGSDLLEEGQTYYFFIDGCSGSICSYEVEIQGNPIPPNLAPDDMCINDNGTFVCEDATYCPDADVIFEATGLDLTVDFHWSITTLDAGPYVGNTSPMTEEETLTLNFENEGIYEVCLDAIDNGCQVWNSSICRIITIAGIPDEEFSDQIICEEDLVDFDLAIFDPEDPNTDGTSGWQADGTVVDFGTVMGTVMTDDGCIYDQQFELMMHPQSDQGVEEITICKDELPLSYDALTVIELNFASSLVYDLSDYILVNSADQNGCDSVVDLTIELLDILNGAFDEDLICLPEGIIMTFNYLESISTPVEFITFEWFAPDGSPLDDGWEPLDPLNNIAPVDVGSGTYMLVLTVTKNGKTCTFEYTQDINFDEFLPPDPNISAPSLSVCESDGEVTYAATDFGDAFGFTWTFPGDATGTTDEDSLTIDWTGSTGGTITLITENGCGESGEVSIDVEVVPLATPAFDIATEVCIDSSVVISFIGDATDIDNFTWGFDGGTENSGTGGVGVGPHEISWADGGDKTITLSYTDVNGCLSAETTETITVVAPIMPPEINCNPNTGEVSFTWDDVPDATYEVEITSTDPDGMPHEGVLNGTTFTVDGLENGETVTIILTIFTNDVCQMVTAVGPGCTSQDCVAPSISLDSDIISFCLDENSGTATITPTVTSGETGTGIFSGPGIVDEANGIFDPDSANIGINTITYVFMTDDLVPCIGNQTIQIEVLETPTASFASDVDTICITDQFQLTYDGTANVNELNWDYGVGGIGTDGQTPMVTYDSPGDKTVRLTVTKDGCESESFTYPLFVQPELEQVVINCSLQAIDEVQFSWNEIDGATGYLVSVNNGAPFETTETTYGETGLNPEDEVTITVTVITDSRCPGSMDEATCIAVACPTFTFMYDNPVTDLCVDGTNALLDLQAEATGGDGTGTYTWTGPNVSGTQFDPNGLTEGQYELFVTYQENSCEESGSVLVNIATVPTAEFSIDATNICVGETVNILYEGSQLPNQSISWTSPGGEVMSGANPNEFSATFDAVGTFDIQLDVVNGDCNTSPANAAITVEPELVFDTINCMEELDQIFFSWMPVDCATEYEVFIDNVSQGVQSNTDFMVTNLAEGQEVTIEVIAVSGCACGNVMKTRICEAKACTQVDLSLSTMDGITEFCISDELTPIEIIAEALGSEGNGTFTWSGTGVDQDGMFDPVVAGVGTHVITYDFLESEGCPFTETITFTVNEVPEVMLQFDEVLCFDQTSTTLEIIPSGGDGNYTINLDNMDAELMNEVMTGETYEVIVTDGNTCTATASVTIDIPAEPNPAISGDTLLISGESSDYSINSGIFGGVTIDSIIWSANGTVICNDVGCFSIGTQTPTETTVYDVTVHFNGTCSVSAAITVVVNEPEPISIVEIPNIISPNNDGENDEWIIVSNDEEVIINSVRVFDRWGNMVFSFEGPVSAKDNTISWDGTYKNQQLLPGVYVYFLDFDQDGRQNRIRSGDITIIN